MKELSITKGEWKEITIELSDFCQIAISSDESSQAIGHLYIGYSGIKKHHRANAKLIADAGTTANKCNLLPSELLERYNEAIEVLEEVYKDGDNYLPRATRIKIEQTISKSKQ